MITLFGTPRGHGHCIVKGGRINEMMAELFDTEMGYCKGSVVPCTLPTTTAGEIAAWRSASLADRRLDTDKVGMLG